MTTCDVVMTCGRWSGHRGHHGGFRPNEVQRLRGELSPSLSTRELECLRLYATGLTMPEVAHSMGIGLQTVKNKCAETYEKLGVSGHVQAFRALGWLQVPA